MSDAMTEWLDLPLFDSIPEGIPPLDPEPEDDDDEETTDG